MEMFNNYANFSELPLVPVSFGSKDLDNPLSLLQIVSKSR
jgi:hypothetical protein